MVDYFVLYDMVVYDAARPQVHRKDISKSMKQHLLSVQAQSHHMIVYIGKAKVATCKQSQSQKHVSMHVLYECFLQLRDNNQCVLPNASML